LAAGVPAGFITAPAEFSAELAPLARQSGRGLMIAIGDDAVIGSPLGRPHVRGSAGDIARRLPYSAWQSVPSNAPRPDNDDWAACEIVAPDGDVVPPQRRRGLLVRRVNPGGRLLFYQSEHPVGTSRDTLVAAARRAQAIDAVLRVARAECGFDHNETRSWHGWHRHVSLVMMALAVRAVARLTDTPGSGPPAEPPTITPMVRT
jgi:SRSO17 transposase